MSLEQLPSRVEKLADALKQFGQFRKRWSVLEGIGRFLLLGPGALLLWFLADWVVGLPSWPLIVLFLLASLLMAYALVRWLIWPHIPRVNLEREALVAESLHGRLDNCLIGSLQLGREILGTVKAGGQPGYSAAYVEALLEETLGRLQPADLCRLIDRTRARRCLGGGVAVAAVILLCLTLASEAVLTRAARLRDAWAVVLDTFFPVQMRVLDGTKYVVRGRPVTLEVEILGARRRHVQLLCTDEKTQETTRTELTLSGDRAAHTVSQAAESFSYRFEYARRRTDDYVVHVGDLPQIKAIQYEMVYPLYTGQPPRTITGRVPKLYGLAGTHVVVSLASTTDLSPDLCHVEWQDKARQMLAVTGRFAHFSFTIGRPERATLYLTGAYGRGFEMETPYSFEVHVQRDEPPIARILGRRPTESLLVEQVNALTVAWLAEDDFGVGEVSLEYKIGVIDELLGRAPREGSLTRRIEPPQDRARGQFEEIFKGISPPLAPGDRITLGLTARDNNTETGPSLGRSASIEIVIVQPDLAMFRERVLGFDQHSLLSGLTRIKRSTDLLVEAQKTVRTEARQEIERKPIKARVGQENWPSGSEDLVGDYFRLLSGER